MKKVKYQLFLGIIILTSVAVSVGLIYYFSFKPKIEINQTTTTSSHSPVTITTTSTTSTTTTGITSSSSTTSTTQTQTGGNSGGGGGGGQLTTTMSATSTSTTETSSSTTTTFTSTTTSISVTTLVYENFESGSLTSWLLGGRNFQSSYVKVVENTLYPFHGKAMNVSTGPQFDDKTYALRNLGTVAPSIVKVDLWFLLGNSYVKDFEISEEMVYNEYLYEASINWSPYWGTPRWRYWDSGNWHDIPQAAMNLSIGQWHHSVVVLDYVKMKYVSLTVDDINFNLSDFGFQKRAVTWSPSLYPGVNLFGTGLGSAMCLIDEFNVSIIT